MRLALSRIFAEMESALLQQTAQEGDTSDGAALATDCYTPRAELSPRQGTAISALVTGLSDRAAAEHAGVHRVTVTRWRLYDDTFRAAYIERLAERWTDAAEHLRALIPQAIDTLHHLLECGDDRTRLRVAVEIVKLANAPNRQ